MKIKNTSFIPVFQTLLITVFSLLLFLFSACTTEQGSNKLDGKMSGDTDGIEMDVTNGNTSAAALAIKRPFDIKNDNKTTEGIRIENPTKASSYTTLSGTVIDVPANAFVDKNGKTITSAVDIEYHEIKTASEIIFSGIPMKMIDENGDVQWMQTAGMFEIRGFKDGLPIDIADGKNVKIDFVSDVEGEYDFWYFDEEKGNWLNKGTSSTTTAEGSTSNLAIEGGTSELATEISRLQDLTRTKPSEPSNEESNKLIFNDLDASHCPGLKDEKEIVLSYAGDDPAKAPKNNKWINRPGTWYKKELKPTKNPAIYKLTLFGDKLYQIDVKLALTALEIEKERADYQERLEEYRENRRMLKKKQQIIEGQRAFRRLVSVSGFGVYNYDILWKRPNAIALNADFDIDGIPSEVKKMLIVYMITDNGRTVIGLPSSDWRKFRFSPSQKNTLLAVLPNNKTAIFTNDDFVKQKEDLVEAKNNSYVFSMEESRTVNTKEDLQDLLASIDR